MDMTTVEAAMLAMLDMEDSPLTGVITMAPMTVTGTTATVEGVEDVASAAVVTSW